MKKLLLFLAALSLVAAAEDSKLSSDLKGQSGDAKVEVIVQFKTPPGQRHKEKLGNHGVEVKKTFKAVKGVLAAVPAGRLTALAKDPDVHYISPNRRLRSYLDNTTATVGAPVAWDFGLDGSGIAVAVVDSGVTNHPDFDDLVKGGSRLAYSEKFVSSGNTTADQFGHGTHVAGIIAGNGKQSTGPSYFRTFRGIAPASHTVNLKVLDDNGRGTDGADAAAGPGAHPRSCEGAADAHGL